jgi:putative tricarboxylic transport membrane protein
MLDLLQNLALGFGVALLPINVFLCLIGVMTGTLIGVLPGVGPLAIATLLPPAFGLPPVGALIMLAGFYFGVQYGGSTTSILVNPGEARFQLWLKGSSVMTPVDGHAMAGQGRAGPALAIAAVGAFFASCVSTLFVSAAVLVAGALGGPLTSIALQSGPAEYFSLMILGLCFFAIMLARGSIIKAIAMVALGLLPSMIGSDIETGEPRMAFDIPELSDGIGFVGVSMGVFVFAEVMRNLEEYNTRDIVTPKLTGLMPAWPDLKASAGAIGRGTVLGSILGFLPIGGQVVAAFAAYTVEKKVSKHPERFGHGAIEGVASPESANCAAAQISFIPLLMLGIPPNAVMVLMVGVMTAHGITPGPQVITNEPDLFWGLIASMWVGNLMRVFISLPLAGLWVKLLRVPYRFIFPAILIFCLIGLYSINNAPFDCVLAAAFGLVGYWLVKYDFEPALIVLGFELGPLLEENLRRAMLIARGDPITFLTRPISGFLLGIALLLLIAPTLPILTRKRDEAFVEE